MFLTNEEKDDYAARNISYECHGEMTHNCLNTISQCVVNIVPMIIYNNTSLRCIFNRGSGCYQETQTAELIIATGTHYAAIMATLCDDNLLTGPPGPPGAPSVTVTNLTALTLTWTAPWPFPVTNYTVTMLNLTSNQITQWTTCDEQLVLRGGGGQCDELVLTVEAETDVGSTGPSTNITTGFPKGALTVARYLLLLNTHRA